MSDAEPENLRVSDAERQAALDALGEHLSAGRLDVHEYGERSARVTTAKTRGELTALFSDLPEPRPRFGELAKPAPAAPTWPPREDLPARQPTPGALERAFTAAVPLSAILGIVLTVTVLRGFWPIIFLLPVAVVVLGGAVLGDEWRQNRGRGRGHRGDWHRY